MIYELDKDHFAIARPLFAATWIDRAASESVLDGQRAGRIFVDDPAQPTAAWLVMHTQLGILGGECQPWLRRFINDAPAEAGIFSQPFLTLYPASASWEQALTADLPATGSITPRLTMQLTADAMPQVLKQPRLAQSALPPGVELRRTDRALAEQIDRQLSEQFLGPVWYEAGIPAERYPAEGYANFARKSFGFCALAGERVVCSASCFAISAGYFSIEIETAADYQGRGIASVACAAVMRHFMPQGKTSWWICDADNEGSKRLAARLGHRDAHSVTQIRWFHFNDFQPSQGRWTPTPHEVGRRWQAVEAAA